MSKSQSGRTKKSIVSADIRRRDARQAVSKQAKTKQQRSTKAKITQLTMQVDSQHAELQALYHQGATSTPKPLDSRRNTPAVGDLADVLRGL
ncbi:hypothetical protein BC629DRAFT_1589514 [Irpex lacteus]|nr:hypothetical protein BC629DRAFT_1589514 [Irpex lacteus]